MTPRSCWPSNLTVSLCSQLQSARPAYPRTRSSPDPATGYFRPHPGPGACLFQAPPEPPPPTNVVSVSHQQRTSKADASCDCKDLNLSELAGLNDVIALRGRRRCPHQKITELSSELNKQVPGANPTQAARARYWLAENRIVLQGSRASPGFATSK